MAGRIRDESGATIVLVTISMVALLSGVALAVDPGRAVITKARLARAVDAAALAGAKSLRLGQGVAQQRALVLAAANGVVDGQNGMSVSIGFGVNADGEQTVAVSASQTMPTTLMAILGPASIDVSTQAIAAVPPVDMVLVLDQSGSLGSMGAFDDLQNASKSFVANFDDNLDQVGLVSFNIRGADRFLIGQPFVSTIQTEIDGMNSVGYTNTGEGLRLAGLQMQSGVVRQRSAKVVVFFTDGRPTASRDIFSGSDRIMAVPWATSTNVAGYWDNPLSLPLDSYVGPDGCGGVPVCFSIWTEPLVRAKTLQDGIDQADVLRAAGILVYTIALGNPGAADPLQTPDLVYLESLANVNGITNPNQPQGKSYFAPTAAELQAVFDQVASDLLARLAS
jgi:Flp pilus assembly protein TadG